MDLESKAKELSKELSTKPWLYLRLLSILNWGAWLLGLVLSPITIVKDKLKGDK